MPKPTSFVTSTIGLFWRMSAAQSASALSREIALGKEQVRQPQRQAIDETRARAIGGIERTDEIERGGMVAPAIIAACLMGGDTRTHFVVEGLGRGDIDRAPRHGKHALFGMAALARARAAGDQDDAHADGSSPKARRARGADSPCFARNRWRDQRAGVY